MESLDKTILQELANGNRINNIVQIVGKSKSTVEKRIRFLKDEICYSENATTAELIACAKDKNII